jgi:hypothetical protein
MKKILFILLVFIAASCTKNFEEMNKNVKSPEEVPGVTLFSNAEKGLANQLASINVNTNIWKIWAQYVTETTYTDEANYDVINRSIPDNAFLTFYRNVLRDLKEASALIAAEEYAAPEDIAAQKNRLAIIEILNVYTYQRMVDMFGDIPYSEALQIDDNINPKYDDAATIYTSLFSRLDAAIAKLDDTNGSFGSSDLYNGGDVAKWKMFANALKLKMGIHIADYDDAVAKANVEAAYAAGVLTSNDDNTSMVYLGASPNTNPMYLDLVASGRHDFVATSTIIDPMNDLADPRLPLYYTTVDTGNGIPIYLGGVYGASNPYSAFSHLSSKLEDPTIECLLMSYDEVEFYLAEAAERGYSVGGDAESHYNAGIEASITYWGGTAAEATTYLANPDVAYATAAGTWKEKIAKQSWIASFNRGYIGWTTWRRLDAPVLNPPPGMTQADIPVRFTYPVNEQTLNGANYKAAAAAVGGDLLSTKLFWDKN